MAKKVVKPAKKASKPAPKKAAAKPAKKVSKPAPKKAVAKPAKKAAKPAPKPAAKKVVAKKPAPKTAPKKVTKLPAKKASRPVATAPKKVEKKAAKPAPKVAAKPAKKVEEKKQAKELVKDKKAGKPIDAIAKKGTKASKKAGKPSKKGKKGDDDDDDLEDVEEEEEDDSDVDVEDEYEKGDDDDAAEVELDEAPILDLEGGGIPLDDDDDDEIPEKRGRGRRKKNEGRTGGGSESYIRNRPLHIDITKPLIKKQQTEQPKPFVNTKDDRSRYSDKELAEFKELIIEKLKEAQTDFDLLKQTLSNADNHGTDDTSPSFKLLEDGSDVLSKEETAQLAIRQEKYIVNLKNALMRIENKTYGICRVTGKLIPKERLRSVPHATLGIDAKLNQS